MVVYGINGQELTIPIPIYNSDYSGRISGATGLDSKISKAGASFNDCTNELTEISDGVYILTLTTLECTNIPYASVICSSTSSGSKIDTVEIFFSSGSVTPVYWRY